MVLVNRSAAAPQPIIHIVASSKGAVVPRQCRAFAVPLVATVIVLVALCAMPTNRYTPSVTTIAATASSATSSFNGTASPLNTTRAVIAIDRSASMRANNYLANLKGELLRMLATQRDEHRARGARLLLTVVSFDDRHEVLFRDLDVTDASRGDRRFRALAHSLEANVWPRGATLLYETALFALDLLGGGTDDHVGASTSTSTSTSTGTGTGTNTAKFFCLLTDGMDNRSRYVAAAACLLACLLACCLLLAPGAAPGVALCLTLIALLTTTPRFDRLFVVARRGSQRLMEQAVARAKARGVITVFLGTEEAEPMETGAKMGFARSETMSVGRSKKASRGTAEALSRFASEAIQYMAEMPLGGGGGEDGGGVMPAFSMAERKAAADGDGDGDGDADDCGGDGGGGGCKAGSQAGSQEGLGDAPPRAVTTKEEKRRARRWSKIKRKQAKQQARRQRKENRQHHEIHQPFMEVVAQLAGL